MATREHGFYRGKRWVRISVEPVGSDFGGWGSFEAYRNRLSREPGFTPIRGGVEFQTYNPAGTSDKTLLSLRTRLAF